MTAFRRWASEKRSAMLDGCLAYELALVEVDLRHGRVSEEEAAALFRFGTQLLERTPLPHVTVVLDATDAACFSRCPKDSALGVDDIALLQESVQTIAESLRSRGAEVYRRKWDTFGRVGPIRDTLLCAPPPSAKPNASAFPSPEAVECILRDSWAAVRPSPRHGRGIRTLPATPFSTSAAATNGQRHGPPRTPTTTTARSLAQGFVREITSPAPSAFECMSPEGSPTGIVARIEDMPKLA